MDTRTLRQALASHSQRFFAAPQRTCTHLQGPALVADLALTPRSMAFLCLNHQQDFAMSETVTLEVFTDYV